MIGLFSLVTHSKIQTHWHILSHAHMPDIQLFYYSSRGHICLGLQSKHKALVLESLCCVQTCQVPLQLQTGFIALWCPLPGGLPNMEGLNPLCPDPCALPSIIQPPLQSHKAWARRGRWTCEGLIFPSGGLQLCSWRTVRGWGGGLLGMSALLPHHVLNTSGMCEQPQGGQHMQSALCVSLLLATSL